MITRFVNIKPTVFAFGLAFALSVFGYIFMSVSSGASEVAVQSIYMRTVFIGALFLLMFDVLEADGFAISNDPRIENPHFWVGAFHMGYFWATIMILVYWEGPENAAELILKYSVAGAVFGLFVTGIGLRNPQINLIKEFDIDKGMMRNPVPKALYFLWPFIIVILIAALLGDPPTNGWDESYILFQIIFLGSLMPLYPPMTGGLRLFGGSTGWPRLIGTTILICALFYW